MGPLSTGYLQQQRPPPPDRTREHQTTSATVIMVPENVTAGRRHETAIQPPAYGDEENIPIRDGLYILTNKRSRTVLDLCQLLIFTYLSQLLI